MNKNIKLIKSENIIYFDLFSLLIGLEPERSGIFDRVWEFIKEEEDIQFMPIKGRISYINLYYFGIGDEYKTKYLKEYPSDLEHSKKVFKSAFIEGKDMELRLDFNLILSLYEDHILDIGSFPVMINY